MALVNTTFSSLITFTRADASTCASFVGANGLIQLATADTPRFDYDPATLAPKGFLIEESRQNLLLQSETYTTTWVVSANSTYTKNLTAPDGTINATSVVEDTTLAQRLIRQDVTSTGSSTHSFTIYAKPLGVGAQRWLGVKLGNAVSSTTNFCSAVFDLTNGSVAGQTNAGDGTLTSATATATGGGWYRIQFVGVPSTTATSVRLSMSVSNTSSVWGPSYTGDGVSGLIIWGAQLEVGAFPTSYIPTTTTAVTRAADSAVLNTLSPWFNSLEGTLYSQADSYDTSIIRTCFYISDGTINNRIQTGHGATARGFIATGGVNQLSQQPGTVSNNVASKTALAYKTNDGQTAVNGTAGPAITTLSVPTVNAVRLGGVSTVSQVLNGHIRNITYYPRRLSQAELITLTT